MESPFLQLGLLLLTGYVFTLWLKDRRAAGQGKESRGALPGAMACPRFILYWGSAGAIILVFIETTGENFLGISGDQTSMTVLFALVTIASGFGEELIFRGYLVIQNKGKTFLWVGIFGFSILFALVHPYLWQWDENGFEINFSLKSWFSTGIVFINSIWFYFLRFSKGNPHRSLTPCILAHALSNTTVFIVKVSQGHVSGLY